jgi:signal transduction histidine kinase
LIPWEGHGANHQRVTDVAAVLVWMDRAKILIDDYRDRMRRVIHDSIRWARLGGKTLEVEFERLSLSQIIDECLVELRAEQQQKAFLRIEIDKTVRRLEPFVADRFLVKILFTNLLDNAIKYSHRRQPSWQARGSSSFESKVSVRAERQSKLVDVFITNWGLGIDRSDYENIFSSFYRSSVRDRLHTIRGVGLGLPTCRKIVLVHKGAIQVRSVPTLSDPERTAAKEGFETTFVVRLPLDLHEGRIDVDMSKINAVR